MNRWKTNRTINYATRA